VSIRDELLKEMVAKLNAAEVGGRLSPWFSQWKDRAIEALNKAKKEK
jgi:hypothetical protein